MGRADELRSDPRARAWAGAGIWPPPPFASASHTGAAATREASLLRTKLHLLVSHGASSLPPGLRGWLSYETWAPHTDVLVPAGAMLLVWQLLVSFPLWAALLLLSLLATAAHQVYTHTLISLTPPLLHTSPGPSATGTACDLPGGRPEAFPCASGRHGGTVRCTRKANLRRLHAVP